MPFERVITLIRIDGTKEQTKHPTSQHLLDAALVRNSPTCLASLLILNTTTCTSGIRACGSRQLLPIGNISNDSTS
jgi:hypothetical protein